MVTLAVKNRRVIPVPFPTWTNIRYVLAIMSHPTTLEGMRRVYWPCSLQHKPRQAKVDKRIGGWIGSTRT